MFDYSKYSKLADERLIQVLMVSDYAQVTDKLTYWQNQGKENPNWKVGPTISLGANKEDNFLDDVPYTIGLSSKSASVIWEIMGEKFEKNSNKGIPLGIEIKVNEILSLLSITMQFALLEYYDIELYKSELDKGKLNLIDTEKYLIDDIEKKGINNIKKGRIEYFSSVYSRYGIRKRINCWKKIDCEILVEDDIILYEQLNDRRNELSHEIDFNFPTIDEAIEYYKNCKYIAKKLCIKLNDTSI